jgi:apolipoprotein N-acyltransferase
VLVQAFDWRIGGRKKKRGKEELKVILWLFLYFVLQFIWLSVHLGESVEVLSRFLVAGGQQ